jgi:sarcosine oxidase gamma subunit
VLPPAPAKLSAAGAYQGDDTPVSEPGIVLVRLPAKTSYSLVLAEQKYLAGAKGVKAASLRRLSPNGWVIGVTTGESIEQIARIAKKAPASDASSSVKIVGSVVEVSLSGSP